MDNNSPQPSAGVTGAAAPIRLMLPDWQHSLITRVEANDAALTVIELDSSIQEEGQLSPADFARLCTALHANTRVSKLTVWDFRLTDSVVAVAPLADMLRVNRSITELELRGWKWSPQTRNAELLAASLRGHPTLRSLHIDDFNVVAPDLRSILTALVDCPSLKTLYLENCTTLHDAAAELTALVRSSSSLTKLELSYSDFNGLPLQVLLDELKINTQLRHLSLQKNKLADDDALHIAAMLRVNCSLQSLDLSLNKKIGEAGWQAIADAVSSHDTLTRIDTYCCDVPAAAKEQIDAALERNKHAAAELARIPAPAPAVDQWDSRATQPGVPVTSSSSAAASAAAASSSSASAHAAVASTSPSHSIEGADLVITQPVIAVSDTSEDDPEVTLPQPVDPVALAPRVEYTQPDVPSEADMRTEPALPLHSESLNDDDDSVTYPAVPTEEQLAAVHSHSQPASSASVASASSSSSQAPPSVASPSVPVESESELAATRRALADALAEAAKWKAAAAAMAQAMAHAVPSV